jgi:hypothetical protein
MGGDQAVDDLAPEHRVSVGADPVETKKKKD